MTTGKILWNAIWRGALWGVIAGFVSILIFFGQPHGGQGLAAAVGLVLISSLCALPAFGAFGGLLLGVLTRFRFFPFQPTRSEIYRLTMGVASVALGVLVPILLIVLLGARDTSVFVSQQFLFLIAFFSTVLTIIGQLYAGWYINAMKKEQATKESS